MLYPQKATTFLTLLEMVFVVDKGLVGIVYNERLPEAQTLAERLEQKLKGRRQCWKCATNEMDSSRPAMRDTSLAITVGGDGTILRTVRVAAPHEVPIVVVNMVRIGFMTELSANQALDRIGSYLDGEAWVEKRTMIEARVLPEGYQSPGRENVRSLHGLNDVVVGRGSVTRLVFISAMIDGAYLTTFAADAVIVATATGSTGYALSVGGPIIHPQAANLLLAPVAPHLTLSAALVLHSEAVVTLRLESDSRATVNLDGFMDLPLAPGDSVEVKRSPHVARFLRAGPPTYFYETLIDRLNTGQGGQPGRIAGRPSV
ncbi:MAG: NAD(+)/NADH kinase [Chloroflexi bacterium]|nr:NAD(+)/NADH kinase [Chloroflexota bacterium]